MSDRIEIDGIDVPCDYEKLEDIRFLLLLGDLDDDELDDSENDAYIERVAREEFDYSKQGERVFVNVAGE